MSCISNVCRVQCESIFTPDDISGRSCAVNASLSLVILKNSSVEALASGCIFYASFS